MSPVQILKLNFKKNRRWIKRKLHTAPLWYQEPDFIFIHINKTGGSSVEKALKLPFEHLTASEKLNEVGVEKWQSKFTFSFVRNPFDKVCSHYRYRVKTNQTKLKTNPITFTTWVKKTYADKDPYYYDQPKMFMPQINWLSDENGELLVDQVFNFESLKDDFDALCEKFSLTAQLPHLKASKKVDYQNYYDAESRQIITRHFAQDLAAFNYHY